MDQSIGRRRFTKLAALAAASLTGLPSFPAIGQKGRREQDTPAGELPSRGEFVVRGAYVITMDPALGDLPGGDVHVKNGEIIAVGKAIQAPNASILDGQRMIVLPGLVETHWHMWNTLFRSFAGEKPGQGYFATVAAFGKVMTPDDMYHGVRLAQRKL